MSILGKRKGRPLSRVQLEQILKRFQVFLKRELQLNYDIPVVLIDDADFAKQISAFGMISKDNAIHLSIINRHPVDIMRTLAYYFVFMKERGNSINSIKSRESKSNMASFDIIQKYQKVHPELFDLMSVK